MSITAVKQTEVRVVLSLTEVQAEWLKQVMQNPLGDCSPHTENSVDAANRIELFMALKEAE